MRLTILTVIGALGLNAFGFANADVFPSCGKREPRSAKAGDSCGGPFVCTGGTTCATLDTTIEMPGYSSAYVCTKACSSDGDCAGLGVAMQCIGMGRLHNYEKPSERVCIPTIAKGFGDDAAASTTTTTPTPTPTRDR